MKSASGPLNTHIQQETTTLAQFWKVRRTDGVLFHFTSHDVDLDVDISDGDGFGTYEAETSFKRSAISNNDLLSVDNLEVQGLLRSDRIDESELRRGLFDFAEVWVFIMNYESLVDGFLRMRRGWFGEVVITPNGTFKAELRGMTQVLSRIRSRLYNPECEHDLGDDPCGIPIDPPLLTTNTAVLVGQTFKVPVAPSVDVARVIGMNFEGDDLATSGPGYDNVGSHTQPNSFFGGQNISTAQAPRGGASTSSLFLDGSGDYLSWNNTADFEMGSNEVTIQLSWRPNAIGTVQYLFSQFRNLTSQRSWFLAMTAAGNVQFATYETNGITLDINIVGSTVLSVGTDYHIAVTRDSAGDWRLFLDGTQEGSTATPTTDPHVSNRELYIGAIYNATIQANVHGWIDGVELMIGHARWTAGFTPPTTTFVAPQTTFIWSELTEVDFDVTVAGTTNRFLEVPDETIPNTHVQGSATLKAVEPWSRRVIVTALGSNVRKEFSVTELTPNSGGVTTGRDFFPDDSMNDGSVKWLTGSNVSRVMELKDFVADDGITISQDLTLYLDLPFDIELGDTALIHRGCDRSRGTCRDIFLNGSRFGGFPDVPGLKAFVFPDAKS